jgi:hypothetical protein
MKRVLRLGLLIFVIAAAVCLAPHRVAAQGRDRTFWGGVEGSFDRTLNVSGTIDIDVSTGSGSINIRQGSTNRVEIHGRIRANDGWFRSSRDTEDVVRRLESNPPIEQSGQSIRIGQSPGGFNDWQQNVSISYDIVVPGQSNVRSHSGSGSQTLEGITGRVDVGTGSGSIRLRDIRGDLDATAGSGSITLTGFRGGLYMRTGSGGMRIQGEQTGRWDLQTGSGGIDIDLPSNASFELSAHTGSGGVDVDFPMTVQGRLDSRRHDVSGKVGGGGNLLTARTGSGHIRIE